MSKIMFLIFGIGVGIPIGNLFTLNSVGKQCDFGYHVLIDDRYYSCQKLSE